MSRFDLDWIRTRVAGHQPRAIGQEVAPRRAAVAVILRFPPATVRCEILFIKRTHHTTDPWAGHMAFPGGRVEPDDTSALQAARRETLEEVGIDLERAAELLGQLDDVQARARGTVMPMAITPFVFHLPGEVLTRCNDEVEETLWVPVATLLDPASATTVPYELHAQHYDLPGFGVSGQVIWGLTYQMLFGLFNVLEWSPSVQR